MPITRSDGHLAACLQASEITKPPISCAITVGDCRIEPGLDRSPLLGLAQHVGFEDAGAAAACILRRVHGQVRLLQKLIAAGIGFRRYRNTDACADADLLTLDMEWLREHHHEAFSERTRGSSVAKVLRDDRELIPAKAGDKVFVAHRILNAARRQRKHGIADRMSEPIVSPF